MPPLVDGSRPQEHDAGAAEAATERRPRLLYAALVGVLAAYSAAVLLSGEHRDVIASAGLALVQGGCGVVLLLRWRDPRPGLQRVWLLGGMSAVASAGIASVWSYYAIRFGSLPPLPSVADALFITSVLLLIVAALAWPTEARRPAERLRYVLDAAVVTTALLLIAWQSLIAPGFGAVESYTWQALLPLTYPVLDTLGVGAAAYAVAAARRSTRAAAALLLCATLLIAAGDTSFALLRVDGTWDYDLVTAGPWAAAFAALVAARFTSSHGRDSHQGRERRAVAPLGVVLPVVPVVAALLVLVSQPPTRATIVIGTMLVMLLMLRYTLLSLVDRSVVQTLERDVLTEGAFLTAALQNLEQPVVACAADGRVRFFNAAFAALRPQVAVGSDVAAPGAASGLYADDGVTPLHEDQVPIVRALHGEYVPTHVLVVKPNPQTEQFLSCQARRILTPHGNLLGAVMVGRDITEERRAQEQLTRRANTDALTGLANRARFSEHLAQYAAQGRPHSVMLLDLDDFKNVNDSLGHQVGDLLLIEVATRIRAVLRPEDVAGRLGGDEFVLLAKDLDAVEADELANRLLSSLDEPIEVQEHLLTVSASLGIAMSDPQVEQNLLAAADLAMYLAKQRGKGGIALFEAQMQVAAQERLALENDLRRAVRNEELHLVYQPIVDLTTGRLAGAEALVRWDDPVRGAVSPVDFIPIAESTGLIFVLGEWVLREAAAQVQRWNIDGDTAGVVVSVNVSSRQLERPGLLTAVDRLLQEGLDPAHLVLEITETALTLDNTAATETLYQLRDRGIHLAVDDFGTGYSSLGRLRAAPVSRLKIDRSFVSEIQHGGSDVPIVDATMAMSHGLGLGVVAEGIETPTQLHYLRRLGCTMGQGYLLSRPIAAEGISHILRGEVPWAHLLRADRVAWDGREHDLTHLFDLAVAADVDVEQLARPLLDDLQRLTGLTSTYLMRMTPDGLEQRIEFANATSPAPFVEGARVTWEESLCRRSMERGIGRTTDAVADFPDTNVARELGITSYIGEPVYGPDNQLYGTLCGAAPTPVPLTEAHQATVRLFARLIAEKLRVQAVVPQAPGADGRSVTTASGSATRSEQRGQRLEERRRAARERWDRAVALEPAEGVALPAAAPAVRVDDRLRRRVLRRQAHEALLERARLLRARQQALPAPGVMRVMSADDDAVMRQVVAYVLEGDPSLQLVAEAHNGVAALGMAVAEQPDLLILDYDLGDIEADEIVPDLRQYAPGTRILLYSGRTEVHQIGQRLGVDRAVHKLDGPQRLIEALQALTI